MSIYTRRGDGGESTRPGDGRVRKTDLLIEAEGSLDELNSWLGWCLACARQSGADEVADALEPAQREIMSISSLAAGRGGQGPVGIEAAVRRMEGQIDGVWAGLPELGGFIVPGGCDLACRLHVARTVCRRAERRVVAAFDDGEGMPPAALKYLNRLSDLLFALARLANDHAGVADVPVRPGGEAGSEGE